MTFMSLFAGNWQYPCGFSVSRRDIPRGPMRSFPPRKHRTLQEGSSGTLDKRFGKVASLAHFCRRRFHLRILGTSGPFLPSTLRLPRRLLSASVTSPGKCSSCGVRKALGWDFWERGGLCAPLGRSSAHRFSLTEFVVKVR